VDWDWCPAHYVWSPRGYIFIGGFWDYPVARRGILFAPVYFESGVYVRRGYAYSPRIVINLGVFSDHLFVRPRYCHYYFGDYYAATYTHGGFYASFSFQSSRYGYDPIYSHQRWEHRQDRDWERRVETSYQYRRDHETARPPRTWAAQRTVNSTTVESQHNRVVVASRFDQLAKRSDSTMRFQPVAREERERLAQRSQEVQRSREQRRTLETSVADASSRRPNQTSEPAKVQLPRSPIVSKPVNQLERSQTPPKAPQAPRPNPKVQPQESSTRPQKMDRPSPQPPSRPQAQPQPVQREFEKAAPGRREVSPREQPAEPETQPRAKDLQKRTPDESQRAVRNQESQAQAESERRAREAAAKSQEESQRNARASERKVQQESEQRARDSALKGSEASQQNARELERKTEQESEQRARDSAIKAREESQRNAVGLQKKEQRVPEQSARQRPGPSEKGGEQLIKKDHPGKGKGRPWEDNPPAR
jgi:hypothetical protein